MSATGRGAERRADDYYTTPAWCIEEFLRAWFAKDACAITDGDLILDPCAGGTGGVQDDSQCPYAHTLRNYGDLDVLTYDIREDSAALGRGRDFLLEQPAWKKAQDNLGFHGYPHDLIISNPPFSLAREFIDKALELVAPRGRVAFLLRLSFLESQKRQDWWQTHMPRFIFVHPRRPSFTGKGTDAAAYAHFVWYKDWAGPCETVVIPAEKET